MPSANYLFPRDPDGRFWLTVKDSNSEYYRRYLVAPTDTVGIVVEKILRVPSEHLFADRERQNVRLSFSPRGASLSWTKTLGSTYKITSSTALYLQGNSHGYLLHLVSLH